MAARAGARRARPAAEGEPSTMAEPSSESPFAGLSVLVVDANPQTQMTVVENLTLLGVGRISTANNGQEALTLLRSAEVGLLICERHMPVMDGLALTRFIRTDKRSRRRDLPIFMMCSAVDEHKLFEARDAGINEFLLKPPSMKVLYAHLLALVQQSRTFVQEDGYTGPDRRRGPRTPYRGPQRRASDVGETGKAAAVFTKARPNGRTSPGRAKPK